MEEHVAAETTDPEGNVVVLLDSVWRLKIVRDHPEIAAHLAAVLLTVSRPDHVTPDPVYEARTRSYANGVGPSSWLVVVVSYEQTPARIVTAFANRKPPRSWNA